jgi:hypothetical protein
MLLTYFLNDFEMVPVAPIITDITFVFIFHMRCISIVRSLYFIIFSASFFLSPEIQHLLTYMLSLHYHELQCLICYWEWFCQFAHVASTVWLPYLLDLFLLILVHVRTSVFCPVVPLFPCIC